MNDVAAQAVFGTAARQGAQRERHADAVEAHRFHDVVSVALVDGMGSDIEAVVFARHAAVHGARVAARRGPERGILACTEANMDTSVEFPAPDGVMAIAVVRPGQPMVIAQVGDIRVYGLQDEELTLLTVDQTHQQRLRTQGTTDATEMTRATSGITNSIGRATLASIQVVETFAPVVLLASDGLYRRLTHERMTDILVQEGHDAPHVCAESLIKAVAEVGSADDATAAVISWQPPVRGESGVLTGR